VIRSVLLPATMALLGERNWYLPRWLAWLPRLGPEDSAAGSQAIAPAPEMAAQASFAAEPSGATSRTRGQP
jgi:RND superfamily putative drug exporter